ncbi:Leiomodin-1, partial [Physocladia obscura]
DVAKDSVQSVATKTVKVVTTVQPAPVYESLAAVRVRKVSTAPNNTRDRRKSKSLFGWFVGKDSLRTSRNEDSLKSPVSVIDEEPVVVEKTDATPVSPTSPSSDSFTPPDMERRRSSGWKSFFKPPGTSLIGQTKIVASDVLRFIQEVSDNNETLITLDLHDCQILTQSQAIALATGLANNTHLKSINLTNTKFNTQAAIELGKALESNSALESLLLERNSIGPAGIKAIALGLAENKSVRDVRLANQALFAGTDAEQTLAKSLAKNHQITKITITIRDISSRGVVDRAVARNSDVLRKQRTSVNWVVFWEVKKQDQREFTWEEFPSKNRLMVNSITSLLTVLQDTSFVGASKSRCTKD